MIPSALNRRWLALAASLALPALAGACNLVLGIHPGKSEGTGGGGSSSIGSNTGGTAGTGAAPDTGGAGGAGGSGGAPATGGAGGTGGTGGGSLTDGLVLLLHMDEPDWTGPGAVTDASGNGNHGTVDGTAAPTPGGKIGGAGLFDGNGWIVVPDAPSLHPTTELTMAVWVYPTGLTDGVGGFPYPGILSKREGYGVNVAYTLFLWEQNKAFVDIQADRFDSAAAFSNDQWYHIAVVYDGAEDAPLRTRIYVNGALDSVHASAPSFDPNSEDIQVGGLPGGGEPFIGKLDEVAIWTRALTAAEIQSVYETGVVP